ncbi:hypothetical protein [Sporosarcina sp. FSL W7-1283]|uniref:hypothetical protein n=1 Tax=Sporosarcina sp. FSL W7-1283 TaxID=2921560 RepID=UPI0030F9628F
MIKPRAFRVFDEGVDVEDLYNAEYWWIDGDGKVYVRIKESKTIHEVIGDKVEIRTN